MDLAMDVYIPEDYVRRRCKANISMEKRDAPLSFNDMEAAGEKKFQLLGNKNMMISASTSHNNSNSFKEDIIFNYFNP